MWFEVRTPVTSYEVRKVCIVTDNPTAQDAREAVENGSGRLIGYETAPKHARAVLVKEVK